MNATADLAREAVRIERARRRTVEVAKWRTSGFRPSSTGFHDRLGAVCDRAVDSITAGRGLWAWVHAPPGHGKSELIGRCAAVRLALVRPGSKVLYVTSTDPRAEEVSMSVRRCMERLHDAGVPGKAPGRVWRTTEWECEDGTGWVGAGSGGATGGLRGDLIVIDDVTGSGARASSPAWRRHTEQWLEEDVLSRGYGEHVAVLGMETRRGPSDLRAWAEGRFGDRLRTYDYEHVATKPSTWRAVGDYLWPERYGPGWLSGMPHLVHGGRVWETLHQGHPTAVEGEAIKRAWFEDRRYRESPRDVLARAARIVIAVDCAASPDSRADWTAMQVWAQAVEDLYLLAESRGQWGINEQEDALRALVVAWPHRARSVVIERSSNGIALQQRTHVTLGSVSVSTATKEREDATATSAKERRAYEFIAAARALRVCVPVGPMGDAVIDEWVSLGTDAPDDRLDAAAHAGNELTATAIPVAHRLRNPDRLRGLAV